MRKKKINDFNREEIRADLVTMTRKAVCEKWGVDYQMLQKEYGFTHKKGQRKQESVAEAVN